jgi:ubiquinone/menaquinone biosynthesis C-methylase UbiE
MAGLRRGDRIVDIGCGSGRDLRTFRDAGFQAVGLDVSAGLAGYAAQVSRCPVVVGDMLQLPFAGRSFEGAWASASILHINRADMVDALCEIRRVLQPSGLLFCSLKLGSGEVRTSDQRFFSYVMPDEWQKILHKAGFDRAELDVDLQPSPRTGERWIRSLSRSSS